MNPADQQQVINTYQGIMEEIKDRLGSIQYFLDARLPDRIVQECCYVQFRMCCELTALACLVAHGDIKELGSVKMRKAYQADKIIRALGDLHPDFYPVPCVQEVVRPGVYRRHDFPDAYLEKDDLIALYHKAGQILHRGSMDRFLEPRPPNPQAFPEIVNVHKLFINLLGCHQTHRIGGDQMIFAGLNNLKNPGHAHASFWEARRESKEAPKD